MSRNSSAAAKITGYLDHCDYSLLYKRRFESLYRRLIELSKTPKNVSFSKAYSLLYIPAYLMIRAS